MNPCARLYHIAARAHRWRHRHGRDTRFRDRARVSRRLAMELDAMSDALRAAWRLPPPPRFGDA